MSDDEAIGRLEQLYASLPSIECQGLCVNACGPISMSTVERRRIEAAGVQIPELTHERAMAWQANQPLHCAALDRRTLRCTVYEIRPLICRIWGHGRGELACPWGCPRTGPRLRIKEIFELLRQAYQIGGDDRGGAWGDFDPRILDNPRVATLLARYISGEHTVVDQLQTAVRQAVHGLGPHDQ